MSSKKGPLPPPDTSGTDPDQALKARFSLGTPSAAPTVSEPGPYSGTGVYGQGMDTTPTKPSRGRRSNPTKRKEPTASRPDPQGMARVSYYVSAEAAGAIDAAVEQAILVLGNGVPKHEVMSALLSAGAAQASTVIAELAKARREELAARLEALGAEAGGAPDADA